MVDPKSSTASVSNQQATGVTATQVQEDATALDSAIQYIDQFNRTGTPPPGGWDSAVIAPLRGLSTHLQKLGPMVEQFGQYGGR